MIQFTAMLQPVYAAIARALSREEGQGFAEYAFIFALVVLVAAATLTPLGTTIAGAFTAVSTALTAAL